MDNNGIDYVLKAICLDTEQWLCDKACEYMRLSQLKRSNQLLGSLSPMLPHACVQLAAEYSNQNYTDAIIERCKLNPREFRNCTANLASILGVERCKISLLSMCMKLGVFELHKDLNLSFEDFKTEYTKACAETRFWGPELWNEPVILSAFLYVSLRKRKVRLSKTTLYKYVSKKDQLEKWISIVTEHLNSNSDKQTITKKTAKSKIKENTNTVITKTSPSTNETPPITLPNIQSFDGYFMGEFNDSCMELVDAWKAQILKTCS